jgi:flagellar motor switch protein FliN/FliY
MDPGPDVGLAQLEICCELGRRWITLAQARRLKPQDVIELDKLAGESFEVRVNGRRFALGETVVVTERMAVRLTSMAPASPGGGR